MEIAGRVAAIVLACLAIFHTPDGKMLSVDTRHIVALRTVPENYKGHLAPGTKSILYVSGQNFGIIESEQEAKDAIDNCVESQ